MTDALPPNDLEHRGQNYREALAVLHRSMQPRTYLEVGSNKGNSLKLADCPTIAIDPRFRIEQDVMAGKPACFLFQMQSDAFFARYDPTTFLGAPIDLAFIDGMHTFEFALRDFINVERFCHSGSVIVLHDCLPIEAPMTAREHTDEIRRISRYPRWWAGDVWKIVPILRRYRPDLTIQGFDAPPTGLVLVTGLSPDNATLEAALPEIYEDYRDIHLTEAGVRDYRASVPTSPTHMIARSRV